MGGSLLFEHDVLVRNEKTAVKAAAGLPNSRAYSHRISNRNAKKALKTHILCVD